MANDINQVYADRSLDVYPSAARTATPDTQEYVMFPDTFGGIEVVFDVTAIGAAASLTLTILGVDELSGKTWPLATVSPLLAAGGAQTLVVRIHPANPTAAATGTPAIQTVQGQIPGRFRIGVTHNNATSNTYTVAAHLTK
jgi:hypothetical protein